MIELPMSRLIRSGADSLTPILFLLLLLFTPVVATTILLGVLLYFESLRLDTLTPLVLVEILLTEAVIFIIFAYLLYRLLLASADRL